MAATTDTTTPPPEDQFAQLQRYVEMIQGRQQAYAPPAPVDRSITSLLGEAVGGGTTGLSPAEREDAGRRALLNFGANLSAASGYSTMPRTFGQVFAQGVGGAQQSLAGSEAVGAARLGAQQAYEEKQQELRLAALKEAIPLLQQQANQRALAGMKPPGTSIGAAGAPPAAPEGAYGKGGPAADTKVPEEYLPFYQEASQRTGIPVDVLIAQARQESGFNAGATGKAGEVGLHQIKPTTAADPGFGVRPIDPAALKDPRANINFAADYLKAHLPPGADPTDPAAIRVALKGYNGGGDPNYVANVTRYLPAPTAPKAADGTTAPAPYKVASTGATAPPASAAAPGSVAAETAGLVMPPGATPPGAAPQPTTPGTAAPASPPPDEDTYRPSPIPDEYKSLITGKLTPAQIQNLETAKAAALQNFNAAKATGDPKAAAAANDAYSKVLADENTMLQDQTDKGRDFLKSFYDNDARMFEARQKAKSDLRLEHVRADESRRTKEAEQLGARNQKTLEDLDLEARNARGAVSELDGLKVLSDNVKTPSVWATVPWGNTTVANRLAQAGLLDKGELGATQMLQTGISGVIKTLRQGMAMGSLSDRDLNFIEGMGPNLYQDQDTRSAVIGYLKQAQQAKIRFNVEVNKEMSRPGTNMADAIDRAQQTMERKYPIVDQIPQDLWDHRTDPDPAWKEKRLEWQSDHNIRPGTLYRKPDGGLVIVRTPKKEGQP